MGALDVNRPIFSQGGAYAVPQVVMSKISNSISDGLRVRTSKGMIHHILN